MRLLVPNSLLLTLVGVLADPSLSQQPARTHNKGEVSGRVELEDDLLLTQRLVAADFAKARGDVVRTLGLLVGVRLWR